MEDIVYPAHYRKTDGTVQSVKEHLLGVGMLCATYAREYGFEWTGRLLGLLHDLGKYTDDFKDYIVKGIQSEKEGLPSLEKTVDHGKYGAIYVLNRFPKDNLYDQVMREVLAIVIGYHHGGLEDYITDDLECKLVGRCTTSEQEERSYNDSCDRFYEQVIPLNEMNEIMKKSSEEFKLFCMQREILDPFELHLVIKILYSCLVDADRYDTYCFVQNYDMKNGQIQREMPTHKLWERFDERLAVTEKKFREKATLGDLEVRIHRLRQEIWKQCYDYGMKRGGIYTLTVPTGGGKTLSSLRYAINHARKYYKKRIIYILPFTSIIEQNAAVVREVLGAGDYLLEHHSNVIYEDIVENKDGSFSDEKWEYYRLLTEQWTSPIIFTTMVQFLNTIFAKGTQAIRRLHNLVDSILIFDEIQALPVNCISLFNKTINFLSKECRDTIILCSATQPTLDEVKNSIRIDGEIIQNLSEKFKSFKRMRVKPEIPHGGMSISELSNFILNKKKENDSILVIMNTKSMAERIYREIRTRIEDSAVDLYFLSTNLCPMHRKRIIKDIKEKLCKHEQIVCISTQLIEAGVDISFSCVIRHIAGLDSIAQAAGRGNRNGEAEVKDAYIVQVEGESLGSLETIRYGEEATRAVLDAYTYDPDRFDNDLLSPKALYYYYKKYYQESKIGAQMDYPLKNGRGTILERLNNINKGEEYRNRYGEKCPTILQYQFRTASRHFEVIDDSEIAVIVPFEEGKEIAQRLQDSASIYPDISLLREAQHYSVNISKYTYEKLKEQNAIAIMQNSGVLILNDRFYDLDLGVVLEGRSMGVAIF